MVCLPDHMASSHSPAAAIPQRISLVSQTVESLRAHLKAGHWRQRLPAERELCQQMQVSRHTLRAALAELQRERVIKLTGRIRRGAIGKGITSTRSSRIVVLLLRDPLPDLLPAALFILDTLRDDLARAGYTVELGVDRACFSSKPARALEKIVQGKSAAVWVAFGSKEPMQQWFVQRQLPLLVIGSCGPGIALPSLDVNFRAACRHAGDLLWRKGHRRLALVQPLDAYDGDVESERGFREALGKHPEAQLRVIRHDGTAAHLGSLLDETLLSAHPPSGYLVVHPNHALTVAMHLMRRKLRLPQDAAVLSRDRESYFQHTSPVLSHYAVDSGQFARKISKAVRELAETGVLAPKAIRLIPRFIAGETV
jgi:DNA-binding LacI/PurR family transcriptional regulator